MKTRRKIRNGNFRKIEVLEARSLLAVLMVTSPVDGAAGSLRDVLDSAAEGDVVRFAHKLRHAHLRLTEGELNVDVSVSIEGTGQTLDAGGQSRIMLLDEPGTSIAISGLTFVGGVAPGDPIRFGSMWVRSASAAAFSRITRSSCEPHPAERRKAARLTQSLSITPIMITPRISTPMAFDS